MNQRQLKAAAEATKNETKVWGDVADELEKMKARREELLMAHAMYGLFDSIARILEAASQEEDT
jgi:hypothetical protein